MEKLKVMFIFGTRPEVIKLAPVISEVSGSDLFTAVLVATGQHREMLKQALGQFGIVPDYNLDIMRPDQDVTDVTVNSLVGIEKIIAAEQPGLVVVQGDTTTAFAGCLAAFYQKVPVAHVEAGLRSYDKYRPIPEEINRSLITHLADIHFVPTSVSWEALRAEGVPEDKIFITGNTVIDALFQVVRKGYRYDNEVLRDLDLEGRRLVVVTAHRRENFGRPILEICDAIKTLVDRFPDIEVVFSVHRNPHVRGPVRQKLGDVARVHLVDPLDYVDMANLIASCYLVLTDSGGIQEEAPALAKPVLVLRDVTERPEAVHAGMARITGTAGRDIVQAAAQLLGDRASYDGMCQGMSPYGDGLAAARIRQSLEFVHGAREERPSPFISQVSLAFTSEHLAGQPLSNELFYRQLDERIRRARELRQRVSVATFDMQATNNAQFAAAVRNLTRSLRKTDTAAALDGRHFVLVMPGADGRQARMAADRLLTRLAEPAQGRRSSDREVAGIFENIPGNIAVTIETYGDEQERGQSGSG